MVSLGPFLQNERQLFNYVVIEQWDIIESIMVCCVGSGLYSKMQLIRLPTNEMQVCNYIGKAHNSIIDLYHQIFWFLRWI